MDKVKIGAFIAQCRRQKQITQEQLAEMLNVTNKSVSKWENGICLPDTSLYDPLCRILNIAINELFAGEKLPDEELQKTADHQLMQMMKYRLYCLSDKTVSFREFGNALDRISEFTALLRSYCTKDEAVERMAAEMGFPREECSAAYDFYTQLFAEKKLPEVLS